MSKDRRVATEVASALYGGCSGYLIVLVVCGVLITIGGVVCARGSLRTQSAGHPRLGASGQTPAVAVTYADPRNEYEIVYPSEEITEAPYRAMRQKLVGTDLSPSLLLVPSAFVRQWEADEAIGLLHRSNVDHLFVALSPPVSRKVYSSTVTDEGLAQLADIVEASKQKTLGVEVTGAAVELGGLRGVHLVIGAEYQMWELYARSRTYQIVLKLAYGPEPWFDRAIWDEVIHSFKYTGDTASP